MPIEKVTLTVKFKVDLTDVDESAISEICRLFEEYKEIMNELLSLAVDKHTTNFVELCHARYRELRQRYPTLPSQYIVTACRHAASIYKSFMKLKRLGMCVRDRPTFRGRAIWLSKHLFRLNAEGWRASIAVHGGRRITLRLLHGKYHERFRGMKHGEAQLVLRDDGLYLNVAFSQTVTLPEISADAKIIAVDVNENVIAYGNNDFVERFETNEGVIRTRYFLKRRRIQTKVRGRELQRRLLEKYRGREQNRVRETHYKAVKKIIGKALEIGVKVIVMEDLERLREDDKGSKELNGRLHRWGYNRFQQILEYEAKLHGLNVKYVDPAYTSRICPACRGELNLSLNGHRLMRCQKCGLEEDRDMIAVRNLVKRYYEECMDTKKLKPLFLMPAARHMWGARVPPESPPMI